MWESLNHIHNKLKFNLFIAEKELTWAFTRVAHLCKTLKYIKDKVTEKALCLTCKCVDNNDDVFRDKNNSDSSNFLFSNFLFSNFWDNLISAVFSSQTAEAFLHS